MIIGLGNKFRRGKDTVANILREEYDFEVLHFSDPLYEECRLVDILYVEYRDVTTALKINGVVCESSVVTELFGKWIKTSSAERLQYRYFATWHYHGMKQKDGTLLQIYGTNYRKGIYGEDYWVKKFDEKIGEYHEQQNVAVADTRFPIEVDYLKKKGGLLWKIHRDNPLTDDGRDQNHISETALDNVDWWDICIINDGTVADLREKVCQWMDFFHLRRIRNRADYYQSY